MSAGMISVPSIIPLKTQGAINAGSRKWTIDTQTPIELHSNTPGCYLFYTTDNTKPEPFKKIGGNSTVRYEKPFYLVVGKRTLKALAVTSDGLRESSVNTKIFQVEKVEDSESEEEIVANTTWKVQSSPDENKKLFSKKIKPVNNNESLVRRVMTASPTEEIIQHTEELPKCYKCGNTRTLDSQERFCKVCATSLPPLPGRYSGPVFQQTRVCEKCNSSIPLDSNYCGMCSSRQLSPRKPAIIPSKTICGNCGSSNPDKSSQCIVCDELLSRPSQPPSQDFVVCPTCSRINSADARFCDWCGSQPQGELTTHCENCLKPNDADSSNCFSCKNPLTAPMRKSFENNIKNGSIKLKSGNMNSEEFIAQISKGNDPNWRNIPIERKSITKVHNSSTQTGEGLIKTNTSKTKVSPGNGYWRQQVEHLTQQMKVYTTNNIEFRDSFSQYALTSLDKATVVANEDSQSVTVELNFSIQNKKNAKNKPVIKSSASVSKLNSRPPSASRSRPSSAKTTPRSSSAKSSPSSRSNSARKTKGQSIKRLEKDRIANKLAQLSPESLKALQEIKSAKKINAEAFMEFIESEEFDANAVDENEIPLLKHCVLNKKFDIMQLLIDAGANKDKRSGVKETTALHDAVAMGASGVEAIDILLLNKASTQVLNKKGKSVYDEALDMGNDMVISRFTSHTSQDLLKTITKM